MQLKMVIILWWAMLALRAHRSEAASKFSQLVNRIEQHRRFANSRNGLSPTLRLQLRFLGNVTSNRVHMWTEKDVTKGDKLTCGVILPKEMLFKKGAQSDLRTLYGDPEVLSFKIYSTGATTPGKQDRHVVVLTAPRELDEGDLVLFPIAELD